MTKEDKVKIDFIINYVIENDYRADVDILHNAGVYPENADHDEIGKDFKRIARFMDKYEMIDIIDDNGYYLTKINNNTQDVKDLGIDNYIKKVDESKHLSLVNNSINIGGDNKGNVNQSDLKDSINPTIQNAVHTIEKKPSKKSWVEKLAWVVGISAGLIAIYEFIIKSLITKT